MPEYLAPGVYLEETSFRPKTIEGVSTSTAGFVGPTRFGPIGPDDGDPVLITSFAEFERIFGGLEELQFESDKEPNYMAHAVRAFFDNGGTRVYIARVYNKLSDSDLGKSSGLVFPKTEGSPPASPIEVEARYPGRAGDATVRVMLQTSQNVLYSEGDGALRGGREFDVVWIKPGANSSFTLGAYGLERMSGESGLQQWQLHSADAAADPMPGTSLQSDDEVYVLRCSVEVTVPGRFPRTDEWNDLGFHPDHPESLFRVFDEKLRNRSQEHNVPIVFHKPSDSVDHTLGPDVVQQLFGTLEDHGPNVDDPPLGQAILQNGNDGAIPTANHYEGESQQGGLWALESIADVSIVAAPGSSAASRSDSAQTTQNVISHCERMRYRVAILDSQNDAGLADVRAMRGQLDSKHAALYYPWVTIVDPVTQSEIQLPPSGFVAGIYARNDIERGVHKSPANEVVRGAIRFERLLNKAQQDVLNPEGINALRFFRGRGYRVWGARTISSDPEWKYICVRRYFAFLERSIDLGTQWAVFEPNGEELWGRVKRTVQDFLFNEWKSGHLLGAREEAYFVRCDRSTMTQNDLDNGRLVCLIGVAPLRPAEFVIFRIGQKTLDSQ